MTIWRPGTWDELIWRGVAMDYVELPALFEPGAVVLDVGCHIGAFAVLAAARGARVLGIEACFENYALGLINTRPLDGIELRFGAVWRSDVDEADQLLFLPHEYADNTGAGCVLFESGRDYARFQSLGPQQDLEPARSKPLLESRQVPVWSLDEILRELGHVRVLKIDVEGAEFPILLTSRELGRVDRLFVEVHDMTDEQMALLPERSRVGNTRFTRSLLVDLLVRAGFAVRTRENQPPCSILIASRPGR